MPIRISLWTLLTIDFCLALLVGIFAFDLTPWDTSESTLHLSLVSYSLTFAAGLVIFAQILGLHDTRSLPGLWELGYKITLAVALAVLFVNLISMLIFYERIGRYISLFTFLVSIFGLLLSRLFIHFIFSSRQRLRIAFLGSDTFKQTAAKQVETLASSLFEVVHAPESVSNLSDWVSRQGIDEIVTDASCSEITGADIMQCSVSGVRLYTHAEFVEHNFLKVQVNGLATAWLVDAQNKTFNSRYLALVKRALDICISCTALILTMPLMAVAVVAIKLESRGDPIYKQIRVGHLGKEFTIYKLRSMLNNAENGEARWAQIDDPRVTRVGRFLRKSRIDELPQLWNVLRGEMSLVGPRPERPVFVRQLSNSIRFYEHRHTVKPGITGWAQINYPYGASEEDAHHKLSYDLFYVKHLSVGLDLRIILRTIGSLVIGAR